MPHRFTPGFADQLDRVGSLRVTQAVDGDVVVPGRVFVAPGDRHLEVGRSGDQYRLRVSDGPPVNRHRPSVDVLFRSVATAAGRDAVGVLMTGMGMDGAAGLLAIRAAGGRTIAQDAATSVVFGMPNEAIKRGAAERIAPLEQIATEIMTLVHGRDRRSRGAAHAPEEG